VCDAVAAIAEVVNVGSIANDTDVQVTVVVMVLADGAVVRDESANGVTVNIEKSTVHLVTLT